MSVDNGKENKGFSGLSDLVSDLNSVDETLKSVPKGVDSQKTTQQASQHRQETPSKVEPKPVSKPSTLTSSQSQQKTVVSENESQTSSSSGPSQKVKSGISGGGSGHNNRWIVGIIGFVVVVWLVNVGFEINQKPTYSPASSTKSNNSYPPSNSTTPVQTLSKTQVTELQYTKPSAGTNNVLSVAEIRWCIREGIRIGSLRDVIDSNAGIDEFNLVVDDYNSRCGSYRYRQGSKSKAEGDVEPYRSQIVAEAILEAKMLGVSKHVSKGAANQPSNAPALPSVSISKAPAKPNAMHTKEAQQLLTDLGYAPGPVDGDYGRKTADAVKAFQLYSGLKQDGWIDQELLLKLRQERGKKIESSDSQPKNPMQVITAAQPKYSAAELSGSFTSSENDTKKNVTNLDGTKPQELNASLSSKIGSASLSKQKNPSDLSSKEIENLKTCMSGNFPTLCDRSLLSPVEVAQVAEVDRRKNLETCMSGNFPTLCKRSLLTPGEVAQVDQVDRRKNLETCMSGNFPTLCKRSLLTSGEAAQVDQVDRRKNLETCMSGYYPSLCKRALLTSEEAAQVAAAERIARKK